MPISFSSSPSAGDMIWTRGSQEIKGLDHAVAAIDAFLVSKSNLEPLLIVHAFSNAGSYAAVQLAEAYRAAHPSANLPIMRLILDGRSRPAIALSENAMTKTWRRLNHPAECFRRAGIRRGYLYSRADAMVPWEDVLNHASEVRRLAEREDLVWTVEFTGSKHVGHLVVARRDYTHELWSLRLRTVAESKVVEYSRNLCSRVLSTSFYGS
ncbi:hypothetical protein BO82DRAFT_401605 [Aspergillus uvarum CBS 121591]|uniref:AB hydrolase-1 domain-containing protein n=1 Tax=Aspergillus uvarum CBS 121591 TaxID=1448315 RepID=A0A319CCY4_9EURO|nr:hypothetical protein BO82DRAFT_401605 [Aspergillus uvarum CBS 121591]PYH82280.1 hypothetical protein BO82DRAFT_401605 [Aspergillus uvarum CBS 121591]